MAQSLLLAAAVANIFILVSASANGVRTKTVESSSSSQVSSSASSSYSYSESKSSNFGRPPPKPSRDTTPSKPFPTKDPRCNLDHELWSNCPINDCRPKSCDDVGFPVACPDLPDGKCPENPSCICEEGYVRTTKGNCVPLIDCPSCGGDKNAQSGCGINCNNLCSNYNKKPGACPLVCKYNGCDCKKGFVFDELQERCVKPCDCTAAHCKVKNEIYDTCPYPCPFHTCGINDAAVLCAADQGDCPPGKCRCKDGYYRNNAGECVLWEDCPTCPNQNQVYDPCSSPCNPRRCDVDDRLIRCAQLNIGDPLCIAGCRCADGYYLNGHGVCVTREDCPACYGPHEHYACSGACDNVCANLHKQNQTHCPIVNIVCNNKCYCDEGYARDKNGICIPICECEPTCPKNEVYSNCIQAQCGPKECSQLGFPVACPKVDQKYCKKGCICEEGYVRNKDRVCVPKQDCPSCGGDSNARSGCGVNCNKHCSDIGKGPMFCIEICYENACDCKDGFYLDDITKKCVLAEKCTTCGPDEYYSSCVQGDCRPQYCTQLGFPIACPRIDPKYCRKGCLCKEGLVRNSKGVCIKKEDCPSCGGDSNARSGCGVNCNKHCSDIGKGPMSCIAICYENACDCKDGFYQDDNTKKCVLAEKCTPTCGPDAYYSSCVQADCSPQNCTQLGFPIACPRIDPKYCRKGCLCKDGLVRNSKGVCIKKEDCLSCGGDSNAVPGCGNKCGKSCSDYNKPVACTKECRINGCDCRNGLVYDANTKLCVPPKNCTPVCNDDEVYSDCINGGCTAKNCSQIGRPVPCVKLRADACIKGCLCKKGYLRDANGKCVKIEDCKNVCNKPNEYLEPCDWGCPPQTCESLDKAYVCPIREGDNCKPQCKCVKGYLRNKIEDCIKEEQCQPQCGKLERYVKCPPWETGPQTCGDLGFPLTDPNIPDDEKCPVKPGCACIDGYVKDKNGNCILKEDCPSCGGDSNAQSGCGINCNKNCDDLGKEPGACIALCKENACDCRPGYYYDNFINKCVLASECPNICSDDNQVFDDCFNPSCRPRTCSEVGFPLNCTDPPACEKGCKCKEGYVENKDGDCVTLRECGTCGGDDNAQSGCGVNCLKRCSDLNNHPRPCPRICFPNACDCKDGFYWDENTKKCVLSCDCTPTCLENEVYDSCINGGCSPRNCTQLGGPKICIDPLVCKGGCTCTKGYLRDASGKCVPIDKCPNPCQKPHEVFVKCPPNCPPQTCVSLNHTYHCPLIKTKINESDCVGECRCIDGFYRNLIGECISKKNCLKCTGAHEYFSCGPECDNVCCDLDIQSKDNCLIKNIQCVERCYCEDYYARDDDDVCISISECPGKNTTSITPKPINSTAALANFEQGNVDLTIEYMKYLVDERPGKNFMFSALSILIVLAQIALAAIGVSLEQLLHIENLNSKDEILTIIPEVSDKLNGQENVTLTLANKIYVNNLYTLTEQFKKDASTLGSEAQNIDFSDNAKAADTINEWVSNKTNGIIKELVSKDMLSANTRVALLNCIYFLGNWKYQFNPETTQPRDFYINDDDTVSLETMHLTPTSLKYLDSEDLGAQCILLPYKGGENNLLICIPKEKTGLKSLIDKFQPGTIDTILNSLVLQRCEVYMPRIHFQTDLPDIIPFLVKTGLTAPFKESDDFTGIFEDDDAKLQVTGMLQVSDFKCDETGTEAAVATIGIVSATAVQMPPITFDWNRPGLFFLISNDIVLLSGVFAGDI